MAKVEILNANNVVVSGADVMSNVNITGTGDSAKLKVYNGGVVSGGTIAGTSAGESFYVYAGGVMSGVTISYTSLYGTPTGIGGILSGCTVEGKSFIVFGNGGKSLNNVVNTDIRLDLLYAGAYASGTIIRKGGMRIYNGTTAHDTTISGGTQTVYAGATVSGVNVVGGTLSLDTNARASAVTATSGSVTVASGARLVGGSITGAATYSLVAGGVMENVTIGTKNDISAYGTFSGCSFISGGGVRAILENGGSAVDCTVVSRGRLDINGAKTYGSGNQIYGNFYLNNATFFDTTVFDGGSVNILNTGVLDGVMISGGWVGARGGNVKNATVRGGTLEIRAGYYASGVNVSGGTVSVSGGNASIKTVTMTGGTMTLSAGAVVSGMTATGGTMNLSSGAVASDVIATGGTVAVKNGALLSGGSLTGSTVCTLAGGGTMENVTIAHQAETNPLYGTLSNCTIVGGPLGQRVQLNAGSAIDCTVAKGGRFDVNATSVVVSGLQVSGNVYLNLATASDTTIYDGGSVNVLLNGVMDGVTMSGGVVSARTGSVKNATIRGGEMQISAGQSASTVALSGGTLKVSNGALATDVTMTGGTLTASAGGVVSGVTATAGTVNANVSGTICDLAMTGGTLSVQAGGVVSGGSITGTATFSVNTGAVISAVTIGQNNGGSPATTGNQGGILSGCTITDDTFITFGGTGKSLNNVISGNYRIDLQNTGAYGSGNVIRKGGMRISAGTTAHDTTVSGGTLEVYAGATVSGVNVVGGNLYLNNNAGASAVTMTDGRATATSGALLKDVTMTGGTLTASAGATVSGVTMTAGAVAISGGVVSGLTANDGTVTLVNGGKLADATLSGNAHYSLAGGTVFENVTLNLTYGTGTEGNTGYGILSSCTIQNGGGNNRTILDNGKAYDCTVAKGGRFDVTGGSVTGSGLQVYGDFYLNQGTFTDATFYSGGSVNILNHGVLDGATVSGGSVIVRTGDAKNVTMYDGTLDLQSAGHSATTVNVSGGTVKVSSGALLKDATFTSGTLTTYTGAVVSNTSMQGGSVTTWGGTLKDYTLAGGVWTSVRGNITLDGTVTLAGCVWIANSAYTITADNATVVFDTVNYVDINQGIVYYLEKFTGAKEFRVSVDGETAYGHYALAVNSNVASVNKDFVVYDGETELGTITVANSTANRFISGSKSYGMQLSSDRVYLLVQAGVADLKDSTIGDNQITFNWFGVSGATGYKVTVDGGTTWTDIGNVTTYTYNGSDTVGFMVKAYSDDTEAHLGDATEELVIASTDAAVDTLVSNASAGATIELRAGEYSGTGAITMKDGQTLEGQGADSTTVANAIYGAGNAVVVKNLTASKNVAGGMANAAATSTDLTVSSATLKDAFAGVLVNNGSYNVGTMDASLSGTYFRNLYGAGYVTGSDNALTAEAVNLAISGGSSSGSTYGAGRAANSATLNVTTVNLTVDNPTSNGSLGAVYAGGYANSASTLNVGTVNTTITTGWFTKFVAGGSQVYGEGTSATADSTTLTIEGGLFGNAVLGASYAASSATATVTTATTTISGGTFNGYVAGAGYVNNGSVTVGSVNLTISGGTFTKYIFGGNLGGSNAAAGTVTNTVNLTLDTTSNNISVTGSIYAGSMNSGAVGSTLVTLSGDGSKLTFSRLYGCGSYTGTQDGGVSGTKALEFNGFSGELSGKLFNFDTFTMIDSLVAFAKPQDLSGISTWNLDLTDSVTADTALIDWSNGGVNAFSGDTMNLNFNTATDSDLLLVIEGGAGLDLSLSDDMTVTFNGEAASYADGAWSLDGWKLSNVQTVVEESTINNLVLSKIA